MIVTPGEMQVGQMVTVFEHELIKAEYMNPHTGQVSTVTNKNPHFLGTPFKILAINLPYIAVETLLNSKTTYHFDTRVTKFMEISKEYVDSLNTNIPQIIFKPSGNT